MSTPKRVAIGIGANLGAPRTTVREAAEQILSWPWFEDGQCSSLYATKPVGLLDQPDFINAAVVGSSTCSAREILALLQGMEEQKGRERSVLWGPRTLDLDLLICGSERCDTEDLSVPHPKMHERAFVLIPLAEIAPKLIHPRTGLTIEALLSQLEDRTGVSRCAPNRTSQ